jgi:hypothetical protein
VFTSLFKYRLRDKKRSDENFLTEALAFVLREDADACRRWVCPPLGIGPEQIRKCEVRTQTTYTTHERAGRDIPDMEVYCELTDGTKAVVLSEHKWVGVDVDQLDRYCGVRDGIRASGAKAMLLFVGSDYESWALAEGHCDERLRWEQAYTRIGDGAHHTDALAMLLGFMEDCGLSPAESLAPSKLVAYAMSRSVPRQLRTVTQKLRDSFDWAFLPAAYGRTAELWPVRATDDSMELITFGDDKSTRPQLGFGFRKKPNVVTEDLCNPSHGIDLLLYIWSTDRDVAGAVVNEKADAVRAEYGAAVQVFDQISRSPWRPFKLAILRPVMDVLRGRTEREQLTSLYNEFQHWGETLFADGQLEEAFRETWPVVWKGK